MSRLVTTQRNAQNQNFVGECLAQDAQSMRLHILLGTLCSQFIQSATEKHRQICRGGRGAKLMILRLGTYFRRGVVSESVDGQIRARYF